MVGSMVMPETGSPSTAERRAGWRCGASIIVRAISWWSSIIGQLMQQAGLAFTLRLRVKVSWLSVAMVTVSIGFHSPEVPTTRRVAGILPILSIATRISTLAEIVHVHGLGVHRRVTMIGVSRRNQFMGLY